MTVDGHCGPATRAKLLELWNAKKHTHSYSSTYLASWDEYTKDTIDMKASDLNGDGSVDNLDRLILTRHLANWEGYEDLSNIAS